MNDDPIGSFLTRTFPAHPDHPLRWMCIGVMVCVPIFFGLQAMPPRSRRTLIKLVTFLCGLFYVAEFFLPADPKTNSNYLSFGVPHAGNLFVVLTGFTVGLGIINLLSIHGKAVAKQKSGWENSLLLIVSLFTMAIAGIGFEDSMFYRSLFRDVLNSFDAAMFAILAFFITSAAFRAFRIKSLEATILMVAALLVMLGQVPIGQYITSSIPAKGYFISNFRLDNISNFLLRSVNGPALRAVGFGLLLGELAIGLRIWLSLERGAYFEARVDEG